MKKLLFSCFLFCAVFSSFSQEPLEQTDTLRKNALNVFMEAGDFIKREIPFINYVRDIKDAHVYIISASQRTGSGGREFTYFLVGQKEFEGMKDTLRFVSSPDDTEDVIRNQIVKTLKIGLIRYVAKTPLIQYMDITFNQPVAETIEGDNWDSWVFRASLSGFLSGQKSYNNNAYFGRMSANRVTEKSKLEISLFYNRDRDYFSLEDFTLESINKSNSFSILYVKSLGNHFSAGGSSSIGSSTYNNNKLRYTLMPGLEYNIFPYSESTRRQFRLQYRIGYEYNNYIDTTIYNKTRESLFAHSFLAAYEIVQKWGSVNINCNYRNYLHDFSKRNLSLNGYLSLRVLKGFSVNFGGGASLINDQLSLIKGGATLDEILLRQKELATQYRYYTSIGISYTFGSIYNNVVNPRFGGSGGGYVTYY
jgi:hypothetical protein